MRSCRTRRWLAATGASCALLVSGCEGAFDTREGGVAAGLGDLPELMAAAGIPGLTIAVIEEGRLARVGAFGVADSETGAPTTPETVFEAASLSKPVFAYAILRLVERRELSLDRPLYELLRYERFGGDERARALTARLVLSHQTGLPNWGGDVLEFGFDPGERFGYSGEGYVYLQRTVEARTGLSLTELVDREVFEPLGMADSRFTWAENERSSLAVGHDRTGVPQRRGPPEPNAAGSLHTTAPDYAKFMIALLEGRGLAETTIETAFTPTVRIRGDERGSDLLGEAAGKVGWGLGWGVQQIGGKRIVWHWGDNEIFHAFVAMRPAARRGVVYFANSSNGLAIAKRVCEEAAGEMGPVFEWLGYDQTDEPGWAERRLGMLAEAKGDYEAAVGHFERALAVAADDGETARRIEWLRDLIRIADSPVAVPAARLSSYAGRYGPRTLTLEGSELVYQREGRESYRLLALSQGTFALEGMVDFRLEVVLGEGGRPAKLVGHYLGGDRDESPRDPAPGAG